MNTKRIIVKSILVHFLNNFSLLLGNESLSTIDSVDYWLYPIRLSQKVNHWNNTQHDSTNYCKTFLSCTFKKFYSSYFPSSIILNHFSPLKFKPSVVFFVSKSQHCLLKLINMVSLKLQVLLATVLIFCIVNSGKKIFQLFLLLVK